MYRSVSDRRRFASSGSARVSGLGNLTADALVKRASWLPPEIAECASKLNLRLRSQR